MPTVKHETIAHLLPPGIRVFFGAIMVSAVLSVIAGAISLPFYFESSSMLYKFGIDKALLRSGKVLGLTAGCLVILQAVLSARFKFLDRIFALNTLMNFHRTMGIFIAAAAITHPVLIFIPEDMTAIPITFRYWPEFVGIFLLLMILGIVGVAILRPRINLAFDRWRIMHQWAAFAVSMALFVHVLFVSETFAKGLPRVLVFGAMGLYTLAFVQVRSKPIRIRKKPFRVSRMDQAGRGAYRIKIQPDSGKPLPYLPGQFGFISLRSKNISAEAHPFTIASTPTRPGSLRFVIRTSGDWTRKIPEVQPGDPAFVDGPFGLFTHLRCKKSTEIIMIAGGIGITPMLSMLRYMADTRDARKTTLVWSNRTREHIVHPDEFEQLEKNMPDLQVIHVITGDASGNKGKRHLDQTGLERLLSDCSRRSAVFVCGPPRMMKDICRALLRIGFSKRWIFTERFNL